MSVSAKGIKGLVRLFVFLAALGSCVDNLYAQSQVPPHQWSQRFGDSNGQYVTSVAVDSEGNIIVTGSFFMGVDFGGGRLSSAGQRDIYIAKFDPDGVHIWSQRFGDSADQQSHAVSVDAGGDIVIAGYFEGTVDFGGGPMSSAGDYDVFAARFDANGNYLWSMSFGDSSLQGAVEVAVDGFSNTWLIGVFHGSVDFGGGPHTCVGGPNIFVAKFDPSGAYSWSKGFGDAGSQYAYAIATDSVGDGVVVGYFEGSIDFGAGPLTSAGNFDGFLVKFDDSGNHVWSERFGDENSQGVNSVAIDQSGNVAFVGSFEGTVDVGGGPLTSTGDYDVLVAKFTANGAHAWSQRFGDPIYQDGWKIATDGSGRILASGHLFGTIDFGGGPLTNERNDFYVAMFDPLGGHIWSQRYGATGTNLVYTEIGDVDLDDQGNSIIAANFWSTIDFGGGPLQSNTIDIAIAKLGPTSTAVPDTPLLNDFMIRSYPNPFTSSITIEYELQRSSPVTLSVYNVRGQRVAHTAYPVQGPGRQAVSWNGTDDTGRRFPSGVYFLKLQVEGRSNTSRMVILR